MDPILAALESAVGAKDIDLALLSDVFSLPAGLLESPPLEEVDASCKQKLLELFSDIPSVIADLEQRRQFCALPYAAVLAWLQSDDLKVHSESCVLFLLTAWVNSKEHPACRAHEKKQLAHGVRVKHLSPTYLHSVLPDLKWFQDTCSPKEVGLLRALLVQSGHAGSSCLWSGPKTWSADERTGTAAMPAPTDIEWSLGAAEHVALDGGQLNGNIFSPDKAYLNGVFYKLCAKKYAEAKGDIVSLGVFLHVDSGEMRSVLNFWDPERQPCLFEAELWAGGSVRHWIRHVSTSSGIGFPDLLGRSGATIAEVVAPSLSEGHLSLKVVIKAA